MLSHQYKGNSAMACGFLNNKSNVMFYGSVRNHKLLSTILLKYVFVFTNVFRIKSEKADNPLEIKL